MRRIGGSIERWEVWPLLQLPLPQRRILYHRGQHSSASPLQGIQVLPSLSRSRTFRYCPVSPGRSGTVQPLQDIQVLPSLSGAFRYCPASPGHSILPNLFRIFRTAQLLRTSRYCPASPGHSGTAQPLQDIQVLPSLSRTYRYCPASPEHSGTAQPLQDIQVLPSLSRTFMYCLASPGHSGTGQPLQDIKDCQTFQDIQVTARPL